MEFSYKNPTQIEFGQGKIAELSTFISKEHKVLVVYGGGSIKKNGVYDQVKDALKEHSWCEFGGVEANPTKETLDKAVAFGQANDVTYVLAVGGGSVVDGSKYIINSFFHD
ncbi:Butanol dehydrogenase-like protein, partial [Aduncisulcus paluster]